MDTLEPHGDLGEHPTPQLPWIDLNDYLEYLLAALHDAMTLAFVDLGVIWWRRKFTRRFSASNVWKTRDTLRGHIEETERMVNLLMMYHRGEKQHRTMRYAAALAHEQRRLDQHQAFYDKIAFAVRLGKIKRWP